jgi:hypothetical protein
MVGVLLAGIGTWYRVRHQETGQPDLMGPLANGAPRVQVEVLNASPGAGLGRVATHKLRDAGLDVVYFGTDTAQTLDSTQIIVRRGDSTAAVRVRQALGAGRVRLAADSARLVDITVRLGKDFAALIRQP